MSIWNKLFDRCSTQATPENRALRPPPKEPSVRALVEDLSAQDLTKMKDFLDASKRADPVAHERLMRDGRLAFGISFPESLTPSDRAELNRLKREEPREYERLQTLAKAFPQNLG